MSMLGRLLRGIAAAPRLGRPAQHDSAALDTALAARARGDFETAERILSDAYARQPTPAICAVLGDVLRACGRSDEARARYEHALTTHPGAAELRLAYAALLDAAGEWAAADTQYRDVLAQKSDWSVAYVNYGAALLRRQAWSDALPLLERAVALEPDNVEARVNLALVLKHLGRLAAAAEQCEAALRLEPHQPAAFKNLVAIAFELGNPDALRERIPTAVSDGTRVAMALCVPHVVESADEIRRVRREVFERVAELGRGGLSLRNPASEVGVTAFYMAYHGEDDRALQEALARFYLQACPQLAWHAPHCGRLRADGGRLRVGILSNHLHDHSIGRVTQGTFAKLDRSRFEVHAFAFRTPFDRISRFIAQHADAWTTLPRDLAAAREAVARSELDVLLYPDVGMDPLSYFMTFARLAPVQCTTWGHPVTTGVPAMDYWISTDVFDTEDSAAQYSETLVRLADVAFPGYYYPPPAIPPATRAALGFDDDRRIYLCPQSLFKFHPDFDAIVAAILRRDPGGQVAIVYDPNADVFRRGRLQARMQRAAPDVADRIVFLPRMADRQGYLQRLAACDVMLDTVHYCGGNTSLEGISLGTPIVTLPSRQNRGRHTYAFYRRMGLEDTVARDIEDYVERAVRIATDRDYRAHLQAEQLERAHRLYEDGHAIAQIESFFERAVRDAQARR